MLHYSNEQLAAVITIPIVTVALIWTVIIFHKNRKKWGAYDITIVAVIVLSILRNMAALVYMTLLMVDATELEFDYCSGIVWFFNSVHTFQGSALTTLAVIGLFSLKLYRKRQNLKQFLTSTHVIYHLFCLTTLCACVGVAAILAQHGSNLTICKFMPFELDVKYNVFIIVLHIFLAIVSIAAFLTVCFQHFLMKGRGFDYLKKSTSDLSELSLGLSVQNENKNYYDTYTVRGPHGGPYGQSVGYPSVWNSDVSNISTTVSSTNSRRPCLGKTNQEDDSSTGLETVHPVLIVCYLFHHLPIIVLCIFPELVRPWPVSGFALWSGLIQDFLIPVGLALVDSRFCEWVSSVYKCSERRRVEDKLPHVGLDGRFRPFGSQPQSLETNHADRVKLSPEPKFPITNGSLYTSIDGRLPIVHNYRRYKETNRPKFGTSDEALAAVRAAHSKPRGYPIDTPSHLRRPTDLRIPYPTTNAFCNARGFVYAPQTSFVPSSYARTPKPVFLPPQAPQRQLFPPPLLKRPLVSSSHGNLAQSGRDGGPNELLVQMAMAQYLGKSLDGLFPEPSRVVPTSAPDFAEEMCLSSDDEYQIDSVDLEDSSGESCCSITTEANGDFEFYQHKIDDFKRGKTNDRFLDAPKNADLKFRITRSNSKRSLENFQAYVDEEVDSRKVEELRAGYGGSVPDFKKIFVSDFL